MSADSNDDRKKRRFLSPEKKYQIFLEARLNKQETQIMDYGRRLDQIEATLGDDERHINVEQQSQIMQAVKAIAMFRKVNIPILGMVENMSGFVCPDCGKQYDIFGSGGAEKSAGELQVPFLGGVPINMGIRTRGDAGAMADVYSDDAIRPALEQITASLVRGLADQVRRDPPLPSLSVL